MKLGDVPIGGFIMFDFSQYDVEGLDQSYVGTIVPPEEAHQSISALEMAESIARGLVFVNFEIDDKTITYAFPPDSEVEFLPDKPYRDPGDDFRVVVEGDVSPGPFGVETFREAITRARDMARGDGDDVDNFIVVSEDLNEPYLMFASIDGEVKFSFRPDVLLRPDHSKALRELADE